ncbi:zinc finger protein [Trichoderma arundinaceum]|uniref:Zinc finger protein n=1 Tax=Trichoderma arundinaceum TaxID=490622 RepID=A0A395NV48_TRIAR|nr:zinc finger protein [Trichoderma arundinaceum]
MLYASNSPITPPTHPSILACLIANIARPSSGRKWFDCAECHQEQESHPLMQSFEMTFACKKCKKCFRKDAQEFDESDEYCPHCDNHFVLEAKTPKAALTIEGEDIRMNNKLLKDERVRQDGMRTIFDPTPDADKLG